MKSQVLLTVWCNISGEAAREIWHWSLSGVKGLIKFFIHLLMGTRLAYVVFMSQACELCAWEWEIWSLQGGEARRSVSSCEIGLVEVQSVDQMLPRVAMLHHRVERYILLKTYHNIWSLRRRTFFRRWEAWMLRWTHKQCRKHFRTSKRNQWRWTWLKKWVSF